MKAITAGIVVGAVGCGGGGAAADAAVEVDGGLTWATYTIEAGEHDAEVSGGTRDSPLAGFVEVDGRDYLFAFDASAAYVITEPVEPEDQLDWNKLPGVSDCGGFDLAIDGVMFGWRWRIDLDPPRLEITAYANAGGVHQWPEAPMVTLDADEVAAEEPLRYRIWSDGDVYGFSIDGAIGGRAIDAATSLPRGCSGAAGSRWAAGLYFGGTSVAPSTITGRIAERAGR